MPYCLYVRKSRADAEAEARGEGETLTRHINTLLELAKKRNFDVTQIYREIVSGETIAARPVMQQLLAEVEQGAWDGVLVMEVERLARGDTIDQGIVAQTFQYSDTKIITPIKDYNPNDEFDEEYFEFGLFMSRREYKTINRRLQRGRLASVKEGKYVASRPPYGYERVRIEHDKGFTLRPVENEADIVRFIFQLYTTGEKQEDGSYHKLGMGAIAKRLNSMRVPAPNDAEHWQDGTIRVILKNPTYLGKVRWKTNQTRKKVIDGRVKKERVPAPASERVLSEGLHPALIDESVFYLAQEIMSSKGSVSIQEKRKIANPLAGVLTCGLCGRTMARHPTPLGAILYCPNNICKSVSSKYEIVEERLLQGIADWLKDYRLQWNVAPADDLASPVEIKEKAIKKAEADIVTLEKQLARTHDLLEQGVYTTDTFLERSRSISTRIEQAKSDVEVLRADIKDERVREESKKTIIPKAERLLDVYASLPSAEEKNKVLKEVLEKAVYTKDKRSPRGSSGDNFELTLYPKLPYSSDK